MNCVFQAMLHVKFRGTSWYSEPEGLSVHSDQIILFNIHIVCSVSLFNIHIVCSVSQSGKILLTPTYETLSRCGLRACRLTLLYGGSGPDCHTLHTAQQ